MLRTVISPFVSVPVLSEQITDVHPKVSTAAIFLTSAFFLAILRNYEALGTDPTWVFELVEKFTYQYSIVCKMPGNRPEKIFSKYALLLEKEAAKGRSDKTTKEVQKLFEALKKELTDSAPSKQVFTEAFMDVSYANSDVGRALMKYVLSKFNEHFSKSDEHRVDFSRCNIEHVLPQKPQKETGLDKKDIRQYVHKLGNLTLLSTRINSKVQNSPPHAKLEELRKSELPITQDLVRRMEVSAPKWGQTQITERQTEFAELAYTRIWTVRTGPSTSRPA